MSAAQDAAAVHPWDAPENARAIYRAFEAWQRAYYSGDRREAMRRLNELERLTVMAEARRLLLSGEAAAC